MRVARDYKFKPDDEAQLTSLALRLQWLLNHNIKDKYGDLIPGFHDDRNLLERQKNYQPRSVVEDDATEEMDGMQQI